jgi:hypothetical protein
VEAFQSFCLCSIVSASLWIIFRRNKIKGIKWMSAGSSFRDAHWHGRLRLISEPVKCTHRPSYRLSSFLCLPRTDFLCCCSFPSTLFCRSPPLKHSIEWGHVCSDNRSFNFSYLKHFDFVLWVWIFCPLFSVPLIFRIIKDFW